jgi:Flp pilus assembly pilin Flp
VAANPGGASLVVESHVCCEVMLRIRGRLVSVLVPVLDDSGQDLIEYALLASIVSVAGLLALQNIQTKMGTLWGKWGTMLASDSSNQLWVPSDPK